MKLIGMLDSPFVRRAAITLTLKGIPFEHLSLSVFRNFSEFQSINPLVKAPTLIGDEGWQMVDSSMIIDWAESIGTGASLMPGEPTARLRALRLLGLALTACEKSVQIVYEGKRDENHRDPSWLSRVEGQLASAYAALEQEATGRHGWLVGETLTQADITVAVAWGFTQLMQPELITTARHPALAALSARAEQLPAFMALPPT
ncbi:Glutathione S-transferase [Dyella sp. OK004]|uniref:glutathione S-transferase n=1 Tax=Dyella sp. OK004 TaxID=1855292 RepID=UPI0008EC1363|nr:glutathione S-transferase N-terminal domain-containing protein [Dyella sp. OK004]SFS04442.1 Glutathione S-transferase [Dyella sp. OK004]